MKRDKSPARSCIIFTNLENKRRIEFSRANRVLATSEAITLHRTHHIQRVLNMNNINCLENDDSAENTQRGVSPRPRRIKRVRVPRAIKMYIIISFVTAALVCPRGQPHIERKKGKKQSIPPVYVWISENTV